MLVYAKNPRGVLYLDGYQIWGKETGQQPRDIPFNLYNTCKDGLEDATYREGYLSAKFGRPFPMVAFTYNEIRYLPDRTLAIISESMGLVIDKELTRKGLIDAIKGALRDVSEAA